MKPRYTQFAESLQPASLKLFLDLAKDAGNWGGTPLVDGNVRVGKFLRGNLTDLKRKGLLTTWKSDGESWVDFTLKGKLFALDYDVDLF